MTARELIRKYKELQPDGHCFDRDTLRFFGESVSDMRVLGITEVVTYAGVVRSCYVLSTLQRNHPLGPTMVLHYFDCETFAFIPV